MERALDAYSIEHIDRYFEDVKRTGLTEHGFPRLASNIGTMLAHGRKQELRSRFVDMMSFCCEHVSTDRAANDFSIQEMLICIDGLEASGAIEKSLINTWRENLKKQIIYNEVAKSADQLAYNWVLFSATSEFLRMKHGLCPLDLDFIDMQISTQVVHLDENSMYRDAAIHPPTVYDNVSRTLFSILMYYGYNGKHKTLIDNALKRAGLLTLRMQSASGEIPYGGRSNQFYHNEAHVACICEFEARRYAKEGNMPLASQFKLAASAALDSIERGLACEPIHHVKNRFPIETKYGCEEYAYFDKYMITTASFLNWARIFCDNDIPSSADPYSITEAFELGADFHKLFLRSGDYFTEIDTNADPHYDASGLGRIHKRGAPSAICLSCPGPEFPPNFYVDLEGSCDFSFAAGIVDGDGTIFKTQGEYRVLSKSVEGDTSIASLSCVISDKEVITDISVSPSGVEISVNGEGDVALMLPVFDFDGEQHANVQKHADSVEISYCGHTCKYISDGDIYDTKKIGCNRNGHYKIFYTHAPKRVKVHISID